MYGYDGRRRWIPWAIFATCVLLLLGSARGWFEPTPDGPEPTGDACVDDTAAIHLSPDSCAPGEGRQLEEADLFGADLDGTDLHCAHMRGANLFGASLKGADLRGADLRGASLFGADLDGARLDGADLRCADLFGASMEGGEAALTPQPPLP